MSIFVCSKCGCVDNTATSSYWSIVHNTFPEAEWDESIKAYKGKPLCSECCKVIFDETGNNPRYVPGKWHGKFPKKPITEEQKRRIGRNGIIESNEKRR